MCIWISNPCLHPLLLPLPLHFWKNWDGPASGRIREPVTSCNYRPRSIQITPNMSVSITAFHLGIPCFRPAENPSGSSSRCMSSTAAPAVEAERRNQSGASGNAKRDARPVIIYIQPATAPALRARRISESPTCRRPDAAPDPSSMSIHPEEMLRSASQLPAGRQFSSGDAVPPSPAVFFHWI